MPREGRSFVYQGYRFYIEHDGLSCFVLVSKHLVMKRRWRWSETESVESVLATQMDVHALFGGRPEIASRENPSFFGCTV